MDYREAANFLFDLRRFRMKPGTATTERLLSHLGDPHEGFRCVQIAGSNGKGSTARMTERVLREAGHDVGLYVSPHMDDVRERVQVNDRPIPESAVSEFVGEVREYVTGRAADGEAPTFFEVLTALAYWYFDREDVDVAVVEVGIGGRHDATSVVDPVASAVTEVSLEHTDLLGDSVPEIARDKAHVAPDDGPLVTAATGEALATIRGVAGAVVTVGDADREDGADIAVSYGGVTDTHESAVSISGPDYAFETRLALVGAHQARNAGIATALARAVADVPEEAIAAGLRRARWPGRFEIVSREPLVVLDGAHNPGACEAIADTLAEFAYDDLHLVFGAMHDKDHADMVGALPDPASAVVCEPDTDRAAERAVLAEVFEREGIEVDSRSAVESALDDAIEGADPSDCVLVTGSLYTVREARQRWTRLQVPRRIDDLADARRALEIAHVTPEGTWRMRGKTVHRVLATRVQRRQARYLKEELLSLGGECALSGVQRDDERVDAVMAGTLAQFKRLASKLAGQPYGLPLVAGEIREALDIESESARGNEERGYPWEDGTAVMGILNVTPDSFHDGGEFAAIEDAVERAEEMAEAGADVVDVGGEATNPHVDPIPAGEEIDRVVPVIERIADLDAMVSIDTRKAEVARAALEAGADLLNDVSGLSDPEMPHVAAEYDVPIVVMHSIAAPVDPGREVEYDDVVRDVIYDLRERVLLAEKAGLDRSQILVDPGLGFGKSARENFELLGRLGELEALGCPILVGHSHKSMFEYVGEEAGDCLEATIAGTAMATERGADVIRVHDVAANVPAVKVAETARDPHDENE